MIERTTGSIEWRVCNAVYKKYYLSYRRHYIDLIWGAFVRLHELKANCDFVNEENKYLIFCWRKANSFMRKFCLKLGRCVSISQPIKFDKNNSSNKTIEDYLPDLNFNIEYNLDLKYLLNNINIVYNGFLQKDKKILKDYFVKKTRLSLLMVKYRKNMKYISNLIGEFRLKLKDILLKEKYIVGNNNYVNYLCNFTAKKKVNSKNIKNKIELKTKLKNGHIDYVEFEKNIKNKTFFITLILNNADKFEIFAKILKIDLDCFKNKLLKRSIGFKLYEINSIRKVCFPQYKMCDLVVNC